jgi:hypothetical protein
MNTNQGCDSSWFGSSLKKSIIDDIIIRQTFQYGAIYPAIGNLIKIKKCKLFKNKIWVTKSINLS